MRGTKAISVARDNADEGNRRLDPVGRFIPVVAIFYSSDDTAEVLRDFLERAGFAVVSAHVDDVRRGRSDVKALLEQHDPSVIVYDLIPPFERQWQFIQHLRETPQFACRAFIYTSANAAAARALGQHGEPVIELHGRENEFEAIAVAVRREIDSPKASDGA